MGIVNFFTRLAWFVLVRRHLKFVKSFKKLVKSTCPQNPTIKRRRKPRPLAGPPKRQSSKKMLERQQLEKRRKCRLREQQKGYVFLKLRNSVKSFNVKLFFIFFTL